MSEIAELFYPAIRWDAVHGFESSRGAIDEALKLGLVNEIVAPEQLMQRAQELAAQLLENSPASLQATKKLLSGYTREQLDRQVKQAIQSNAAIRQTADFKEGITAFLEKRKPTWTGK